MGLQTILSFFTDSKTIGNTLLLLGILYNGYTIKDIGDVLKDSSYYAETNYAMEVVEFGFRGITDDDEIFELVKKWKDEKKGDNIGALNVLCKVLPNRLEEIVSSDTAKAVCRIIK